MSKRQRLPIEARRDQILSAAIIIAEKDGYEAITRDTVAIVAGCANGQVNRVFNTMNQLRRAVIRHAVQKLKSNPRDKTMLQIVGKGIASNESAALTAPKGIKQAALNSLMG